MTQREILIANTKTQKKYKVTTDATTLGELKNVLDGEGIDYSGMDFTEGVSNTRLIDDASQLPTNVMFKGQPTNNLVILLTNATKKIESGAEDRKTAYQVIKNNSLQEEVKEEFGRNFTLVATSDLWDFINRTLSEDEQEVDEEEDGFEDEEEDEKEEECEGYPEDCNFCTFNLANSIYDHIKMLAEMDIFSSEEVDSIAERAKELAARMKEEESDSIQVGSTSFSKEDIDSMMNKA